MSVICRVVIGYFDGPAACNGGRIAVEKPLDDQSVAELQAACDELFAIELRLRDHLAPDGLLRYTQEMVIHPETFEAGCVAHTLFDMSAIDHAHRHILFPLVEPKLPSVEKLLEMYDALKLTIPKDDRRTKAEQDLKRLRAESEFRLGVQAKVREFAEVWRCRKKLG